MSRGIIIFSHEELVTEEARLTRRHVSEELGQAALNDAEADAASRHLDFLLFDEARAILGKHADVGDFVNPHSNQMTALASPNRAVGILFDRQYSSFMFELSVYLVAVAFTERLDREMLDRFEHLYRSMGTPELFEEELAQKAAFIRRHTPLMPIADAIWRAMWAFVLCHEIAHHRLGHLRITRATRHELQADRLGYVYFQKLIAQSQLTEHLRLSQNLQAVPCLFFKAYESWESWRGRPMTSEHYPSNAARRTALEERFGPLWNEAAVHLHSGCCAAFDEVNSSLDKRR